MKSNKSFSSVASMAILSVLSVACIIDVPSFAKPRNMQQCQGKASLVTCASNIRMTLIGQYVKWSISMSKQQGAKALILRGFRMQPSAEPEAFNIMVQSFVSRHENRSGPYVLQYLLSLNNPMAVSQDKKIVDSLMLLGNSFSSAVAWEIKRRRKAGEDAKWLENLLSELEGDLSEKWVQTIEAAPRGYEVQKSAGKRVRYVAIPPVFETDPGDPVALDFDKGKLVKWPGPELPKPGGEGITKVYLEKLKKNVLPTARRENLAVYGLSFEALIVPSAHWRFTKPRLLQGRYDRHKKFDKYSHLIGRGPAGTCFVIRLKDGRRVILQSYPTPDEYGAFIAYAVFGKDEDPMRIAPPVDPKTALKRIGKDEGKRGAYLNHQFYQKRRCRKLRSAAVRKILDGFPEVRQRIDGKTAKRLRALGELRVVPEAGCLIAWLSVEAPDADVHPARQALAKIGTMATLRERALLGKSVTERLLEAYEEAGSDRIRVRIYKTLEDIYPTGLVDYLIESRGLEIPNTKGDGPSQ